MQNDAKGCESKAPYVYLHSQEKFMPGDIGEQ